jgi:succinate dehydrogenase / fumarate reductase cytochrome b subunit
MAGNLLLFCGPETYNEYSYKLVHNPLLLPAEIGLLLAFVLHVYLACKLTLENRAARPLAPANGGGSGEKAARFGSKSMILTGILVFVFVILHLITFKWGTYYEATYGGTEMRDLYRLAVEKFSSPLYVGWYLFSLVILGIHLSHGFSATFQSLGFNSVRRCGVKKVGYAFAAIVAFGFISQPIYLFLTGGK